MGNTVGTFNDDEVKHLSEEDREKLKQHTVEQLQTNQEIRELMKTNPKLFTGIQEVRDILKKQLAPVLQGMPPKS
ncbi:hypothetical protein [Bradyrhizobium sp. B117]|uniref:hypothetical protein n=1 Tax=Bradyrhizobium sp. B117 TaxID=3140246 RepID=UPI0031831DC2